MRFSSLLIAGGLLASLSFSLPSSGFAQVAPASDTQAPQTTPAPQTPAPAAQPPAAAAPAPLKLESLPPSPHTPTPEEEAAIQAERVRAQIQRLAVAQNNWGAADSAPGMALALKETGRAKTANGTEITYQITATGFPPDLKLTLIRWPLNQQISPVMDGIVINSAGTAVCGGTDAGSCGKTMQANAPVEVKVTAAKGEAVRVGLVTADKKQGAATSAVPFPLSGEDKGCKLQVLLGTKNAELVLIQGDGFNPSTAFTMGAESFGQKQTINAKPNAQGHFVAAMTPWINGHDNGDTVIYYQSDACTPTLSFHWGKDTYKTE